MLNYLIKIDTEKLCKDCCIECGTEKTLNTWRETWLGIWSSHAESEYPERFSSSMLKMPITWNTLFHIKEIRDNEILVELIDEEFLDNNIDKKEFSRTVEWLDKNAIKINYARIQYERKVSNYVYTVEELMPILKIGRNSAYALCKDAPFPVIKIRNQIRIPIESFNKWLNNANNEEK